MHSRAVRRAALACPLSLALEGQLKGQLRVVLRSTVCMAACSSGARDCSDAWRGTWSCARALQGGHMQRLQCCVRLRAACPSCNACAASFIASERETVLMRRARLHRLLSEGLLPLQPASYGLHNALRRHVLLLRRARCAPSRQPAHV